MYSTPATGNSQNPNDLEDYLLGKKRVDKILTADETAKVCPCSHMLLEYFLTFRYFVQLGASYKNFIAVQNANNARDIAAKIREDPLLAIKQQEQATLQALLSNPLRLKKMQEELGVKPKKDKERKRKEKEERKRLKQERKHRKHIDKGGDRSSRTPSPSRERMNRGRSPDNRDRSWSRSRSPRYRADSCSPVSDPSRRFEREARPPRRWSPEHYRGRSRSRSPRRDRDQDNHRPGSSRLSGYDKRENGQSRRDDSPPPQHKRSLSPSPRRRSPPPKRSRYSPPPPPVARHCGSTQNDADRAARLAAMQCNATTMSEDRQKRLTALLEKEKAELEADERAREKGKGVSSFLSREQKKVFGGSGGLEDRIRRGRGGMVVDAD